MVLPFSIKTCTTKAGYEATLEKPQPLVMDALRKQFTVVADAYIILVLNINGIEVIVHNYGKLVFKKNNDEQKLKRIAEQIFRVGVKNI